MVYYSCDTMEDVARVYLDETGAFSGLPDFVERHFALVFIFNVFFLIANA